MLALERQRREIYEARQVFKSVYTALGYRRAVDALYKSEVGVGDGVGALAERFLDYSGDFRVVEFVFFGPLTSIGAVYTEDEREGVEPSNV